jgi:hypothetical protein
MRTILAAIIGYLIFAVSAFLMFRLTGHQAHGAHEQPSTEFIIISIVVGMVAALIGGYVAAAIAGKKVAATIVAIVIAAGAILSGIAAASMMHGQGLWSNIAAVVLMAPAAKLGGALAKRSALYRLR